MNAWKERVCSEVDRCAERLVRVSQEIYDHPELKFEERRASRLLADALETAGFTVERGVAGIDTAIRAAHPPRETVRPSPSSASTTPSPRSAMPAATI